MYRSARVYREKDARARLRWAAFSAAGLGIRRRMLHKGRCSCSSKRERERDFVGALSVQLQLSGWSGFWARWRRWRRLLMHSRIVHKERGFLGFRGLRNGDVMRVGVYGECGEWRLLLRHFSLFPILILILYNESDGNPNHGFGLNFGMCFWV